MVPRCLLLGVVLALVPEAARAQLVQGQVDVVGFQTSGGPVFREGQWYPLIVSLRTQGSQLFSGELRVEGIDLDGDRVAFTRTEIILGAETGPPKRFWCYGVANAPNELPEKLDLVDENGALAAQLPLPAQPTLPLLSEDLLILDISHPAVSMLSSLQTAGWTAGQRTNGVRPFYRNPVIARMPAADLPDRWWGLEAVDVIVWDTPDLAVLSLAQRDALFAWVRNGGQLVLGLGTSWGALQKSEFAPLLPLEGDGAPIEVESLRTFFDAFCDAAWSPREFRAPVVVTTAQPKPDALRTLHASSPGGTLALITMRLFGSGRVVSTAGALRDLTSVPVDPLKFFGALLDLNPYTTAFVKKQQEVGQYSLILPRSLYEDVVLPIGFRAATALRGLTALLFVVAYGLAATVASWYWLRRRSLTHLSWIVFAAFAVVGSAVSLATVTALRSLAGGVQSVSILDGEAGAATAHGLCLFGYRSPLRQRVSLSLPGTAGERDYLRPLAPNPRAISYYVTPSRYSAFWNKAALDDLLMRATLKQFEGFWSGDLNGTLRADLRVDRGTGRLTPASWVANELNVDLAGGYLFFIDPRQGRAAVAGRAAGLTTPYRPTDLAELQYDIDRVPPAANVLAVRLPAIPAGQQVAGLGQADYARVAEQRAAWYGAGGRRRSQLLTGDRDLRTLWAEQFNWAGAGALVRARVTTGDPVRALLLASTRNLYLHTARLEDPDSVGSPLSFEGLPDLDITHWLLGGRSQGTAVLMCWSESPGPARLVRNGKPMETHSGLTFYRVRVPIAYEGSPP